MEDSNNPIESSSDPVPNDVEVEMKDVSSKRKKKNSLVWDHFNVPDPVPNVNPRCSCKYCFKDYAYAPSKIGTSSLWNHLYHQCKKYPHKNEDKKQRTLMFEPKEGGNLISTSFNKELCRKALVKMIIIDELPFRIVEKMGFRYFCSVLQPKLELPSRMTLARDIISLYVEEKKKLKAMFTNSSQHFCLTTDTWTSVQNINYMVLTVHYIDDDWRLQKRILNFEVITNHKGETIGKMIEACLIAWGIERVFTITLDNASSNDGAISYMQRKIRNWGKAVLNCDFLHMRCCAHILNLIVTNERRLMKFKSFMNAGQNSEKTELEIYLAEAKEAIDGPFDLLAWWKANSNKYKILSRMTKDVLAIPVSTVASESAFSTGGRVLDPFRSSLSPKTVQALICAQNWLRSEATQDRVDLRSSLQEVEDLEEIENDFANQLKIYTDHIE